MARWELGLDPIEPDTRYFPIITDRDEVEQILGEAIRDGSISWDDVRLLDIPNDQASEEERREALEIMADLGIIGRAYGN